MHSTKLLMMVCTVAVGAGLLSAHAEDNPAQAAARAAMMGNSTGWVNPSTVPKNSTPPPAESHSAPMITTTVRTALAAPAPAATSSTDTEAQAKARVALDKKLQELETQSPATTRSRPVTSMGDVIVEKNGTGLTAAEAAALKANPRPGKLVMQPIMAPSLPISSGQQMQLDELLTRYKADRISPDEYQKQRAAILTQP